MRFSYEYDTAAQALYLRLSDAYADSQVEMADGVVVDVSADGQIVGIDVMNPTAGWDVAAIVARWGLQDAEATFVNAVASAVLRDSQITHGRAVLASVA
jgi:uncharacterized protein YuzE